MRLSLIVCLLSSSLWAESIVHSVAIVEKMSPAEKIAQLQRKEALIPANTDYLLVTNESAKTSSTDRYDVYQVYERIKEGGYDYIVLTVNNMGRYDLARDWSVREGSGTKVEIK